MTGCHFVTIDLYPPTHSTDSQTLAPLVNMQKRIINKLRYSVEQ